MDDLFYVDTQGSAGIQCTASTTAREFTVSTSNATRKRGPRRHAVRPGIEIINDDITTPAAATKSRRSKRGGRGGKKQAQGLDSQFLQLEVSDSSVKGKSKKKPIINRAQTAEKKAPPPRQKNSSETDECMDDFIANLGEEGLEELLSTAAESGFMRREIGGGMDYNYKAKASTSKDTASSYDDDDDDDGRFHVENALEDDMDVVDEIFQSSEDELDTGAAFRNNGGYDEDDGFPCSIDLQSLPGPSKSRPRNRKQNGGRFEKPQDKGTHKGNRGQAKDKANDREGPSPGFDPYKVLKRLDMLARSDDMSSLWMEPMNRHERQIVHIFAREYGVKSKSHGSGARRAPILTATQNTQIPRQRRRINRILTLYDNGGLVPEEFIGGQHNQGSSSSGKGKKGNGRHAKESGGVPSGALHGKMVAADAPAVGSSNIGHKMLEQMGWQPGTGLGVQEEGRATPVDVMIRGGRRGLGA